MMSFLEAYDALSSDDLNKRLDAGEVLIVRYGSCLTEGERHGIRRIYNDAWEAMHGPKEHRDAA